VTARICRIRRFRNPTPAPSPGLQNAPLATYGNPGGIPPLPMLRPRATAATLEARTAAVVALVMAGARRSDVLAHCATAWGLAPRSADRLLAAARLQIRSDWEVTRPELLAELLAALSQLQQQARAAGQLGTALACINAAARIAGLD